MPAPAAHPSEGTLANFLLGRLDDGDQVTVERHLSACPECLSRAAALPPAPRDDTLVELVAAAGTRLDAERAAACTPSVTGAGTASQFAPTYLWSGTADEPACAPPPALADHPRYRVHRSLGRGGMGSVWLAEHAVMNRPVAVKVIRPELLARPGAAARFLREVRAAAKLHHPNIVTAFDAEQVGDSCLLVMEFIDGATLADLAREGPLPAAEACRAIRDAARGLAHAHAAGLVHRDVKPHNLMRAADGTVKVLDFGLAGVAAGDEMLLAGGALTGAGMVFGTPDYIAPEQIGDPHAADARADVYGLGCTLFHLLAGRAPFAGRTALEKLDAHRHGDRPPELPESVPPGLAAVVARMMARQPSDRYQTADEAAAALEPFARAESAKPRGLRRWAVAAGLAVLFGAAAAAGTGWVIIRDKDGKEVARVQVPDGGKVEVTPAPPPGGPKPPQPKPVADDAIVLKGHTERVRQVAFGPDAKVVYSASDDKTVRAWDRETGRELRRFDHPTRVLSLALIDGGSALVTLGDRQMRVWDTTTGKELEPFPALDPKEGNRLSFVAPSPDGKRLATGSIGGEVRVWDVAARKVLRRWPGRTGRATYYVAWSPDGKRVAAGMDRTVNVWDADTGGRVFGFPHAFDLMQLVYAPDGRTLAVGDERGTVLLLSAATGEVQKTFQTRPADQLGGQRLAYAPGNRLVVTARSPTVGLWDAGTGQRLDTFTGHTAEVNTVALSADAKWLAAGAEDGTVRVFPFPPADPPKAEGPKSPADPHALEPTVTATYPGGERFVAIDVSADGSRVTATRLGTNTGRVYDAATGKVVTELEDVFLARSTADGRLRVTVIGSTYHVFDAKAGTKLRSGELNGHFWSVLPVPGGSRMAFFVETARNVVVVRVVDVASGEKVSEMPWAPGDTALFFANGARTLVQRRGRPPLTVIDAAGKPVDGFAHLRDLPRVVTMSADERWLVCAAEDGFTVHEFATGKRVHALDAGPDAWGGRTCGTRFLSSLRDPREFGVWDLTTGRLVARLRAPNEFQEGGWWDARLSADGSTAVLATGTRIHIWRVPATAPAAKPVPPPAPADLSKPGVLQYQPPDGRRVHSAQIGPDGRTFLVSRGDRTELFDTATGSKLHAFPGWIGYYALGGNKVLCAGPNNRLTLYDRATGKLDRTFGLFKADIWQICPIGPDAAQVLVTVADRTHRLFDVARGEELLSTEFKGDPQFTFTADGKTVLIREPFDTAYKAYDAATGKPVKGFEAVAERALLGPFSADGTQAQSWDGKETRIVRVSDGEVVGTYPAHPDGAFGVGYSPNRTRTLIYRASGQLELRDSITGAVLSALKVEFPGNRDRLMYLSRNAGSADGRFALLVTTDGHVAVVRLPDPKPAVAPAPKPKP